MKLKRLFRFIAFISTVCTTAFAEEPAEHRVDKPDCKFAAEQFLSAPTNATIPAVRAIENDSCWIFVSSENDRLDRLFNLVRSGNQWAAIFLASRVSRLDGGNLEDGLIALGQFGDQRPSELLRFAQIGYISDDELIRATTMLPGALFDNVEMQRKFVVRRKARFANVDENALNKKKMLVLSGIKNFLSQIDANK